MKKLLLSLTALVLSASAFAQFVLKQPAVGALERNTVGASVTHRAAHRVALAENQYLFGGYTTDAYATSQEGLGLRSYPGTLRAAIELPAEDFQTYDGAKVVKMRVALANAATVSRVFIVPITATGSLGTEIVSQTVNFNNVGWNEVEIEAPVTLDFAKLGGVLMGFDYVQTSTNTNGSYPLSAVAEGNKSYNFYIYGSLGQGTGWYSMGNSYGNLSVQAVVEMTLPAQQVSVTSLTAETFSKVGTTAKATVGITSMGTDAITSLGFNVYVDDVKVAEPVAEVDIATTQTAYVPLDVPIAADLSAGQHTLRVELTSVNGAAPTTEVTDNNKETIINAYSSSVDRQKQLVEHFTSWTCTYCYLGYSLLRSMESQHKDVAWVALHGNQSSQQDPYYFEDIDNVMYVLGANAFPTASFNRTYIPDAADGDEVVYGLGYSEQYSAQMAESFYQAMSKYATPSFVTLDIQSSFDDDSREMQVTVQGTGVSQASSLLADNNLTIYVTEAGLSGRQYSNGAWVASFDHNNTLRAILTNYDGDPITWDGDNFSVTKTYTVPASYNAQNFSIVAFVAPKPGADAKAMAVNNCERVSLNVTNSIRSVKNAASGSTARYYDLQGRSLQGKQRGLTIVKQADGSARKVLVK